MPEYPQLIVVLRALLNRAETAKSDVQKAAIAEDARVALLPYEADCGTRHEKAVHAQLWLLAAIGHGESNGHSPAQCLQWARTDLASLAQRVCRDQPLSVARDIANAAADESARQCDLIAGGVIDESELAPGSLLAPYSAKPKKTSSVS